MKIIVDVHSAISDKLPWIPFSNLTSADSLASARKPRVTESTDSSLIRPLSVSFQHILFPVVNEQHCNVFTVLFYWQQQCALRFYCHVGNFIVRYILEWLCNSSCATAYKWEFIKPALLEYLRLWSRASAVARKPLNRIGLLFNNNNNNLFI